MSSQRSVFGEEASLEQAMIVSQGEKGPTNLSTKNSFPFLKLPPELRTMVYEPLIAAGDLRILTVSNLVNQEAVSLLSKVASLRVKLGRRNLCPVTLDLTATITLSGALTLMAPDYIQHVNFYLDKTSFAEPPTDPKLISWFSGNRITRESCNITITLAIYHSVPHQVGENQICQAIAALTGFKMLVLKLEHERVEDTVRKVYGSARAHVFRASLHRYLLTGYERLFAFLQTTLGPGQFQRNVDRHFLRFWPRENKAGDCLMAAQRALRGEN